MPKELAFPPLRPAWRALVALLLPACEQAEAALVAGEPGNTQPLLPLLAMQGICETDPSTAAEICAHVFAEVLDAQADAADPYRPAGEPAGYDPNAPLPPGAPLRKHLVKMLCSSTAPCRPPSPRINTPRLRPPRPPARPASARPAQGSLPPEGRLGQGRGYVAGT